MMVPTLLASAARILWRIIERNGADPASVFRVAGLDPAQMDDPRARYPVKSARAAWREAARVIDNPCFGLEAARAWRSTDFHALGYAFLASRTLRTAVERIVRYNAVVDSVVDFDVELDATQLRLTYRIQDPEIPDTPALQDGRWAVVLGMCRAAYGSDLEPSEVAFTHPAPRCRGDYFGLFRCPVRFEAPVSQLVLGRAEAERPLPAANRELACANDAILTAYLGELDRDDVVSRAKAVIIEHLPSGAPSADIVAKDMLMSSRTFSRRLAGLGTSYSQLLETVRRELAEQYVLDPSRSLSEISFLLGFSEPSAFSRAFRRWTGQAPSAARNATA
jgi:AraC-like DNA-binding protein